MRSDLGKLASALALSIALATWASADSADDQFAVAAGHYSQARWELAVQEFQSFLRDHAADARAGQSRFFLGEALVQLGRYADARGQFSALLEREPANRYAPQALFRRGEAAYLAGTLSEARADLVAFRDKNPNDPLNAYCLPYLAEIELAGGRAVDAEKLFAAALKKFPSGPLITDCRLGIARCLEKQGRLEEAAVAYKPITESGDSESAGAALFHLGSVQNTLGRHEEAAATLASLSKEFPSGPLKNKAVLGRGWALYKLARYQEAEQQFASLADDPQLRIEARYWLGLSQKAQQHWDDAAESLLAAASLDEKGALVSALRYHAGDALLRGGKPAEATGQFDCVLNANAKDAWADDCLLGKVRGAIQQGDYPQAEQLTAQFLTRFTDSPLRNEANLTRGLCLAAQKKYAVAVGPLESYLKRKSSEESAAQCRVTLVACYAQLGDFEHARQTYAELEKSNASGALIAQAAQQLAECAYTRGQPKLAAELFENLSRQTKAPEYIPKGLSGMAWTQFQSGDWASAAANFGRVVDQYPQDALAAEAAVMRGQSLEKLQQAEPALAMYTLAIAKFPKSQQLPTAIWKAAQLQEKLHRGEQAVALYRRIIAEFPKYEHADGALYHCAFALRDLRHAAEGDKLLEQLRRDYPTSPLATDAGCRLAESALSAGRYDDADKLLKNVAASKPTSNVAELQLFLQGRLAVARGQWDRVEAPLSKMLTEHTASKLGIQARYWIAEALYRQERYDEAAAKFKQLSADAPASQEKWRPMIPLRHAQSLAQLKQFADAIEIAQKIEHDFPQFELQYEADYLVGRCLASQADFAGARKSYAKVIGSSKVAKTETAATAQWMIGESYFHQEDYPSALREYLRVEILYAYPRWQAAALLQAGKCHEQLGEWGPAADIYARLLKTYPKTEFTDEAKGRLAVAQQRVQDNRRT